jgi:NhaA family Na+:H+ antiporter
MAMASESPPPDATVAEPIEVLLRPLQVFASHKLAGAGLLLLGTVSAVIWANSAWASTYHHLLALEVTVSLGPYSLTKDIHHLINDGLMSVFFFLVGLEIKRELLVGELSTVRRATLPAVAALGGMFTPAAIYLAINHAGPARVGWGVPMATDIAFALGVLAVAGSRVPVGLKVMLTALAIVDDIGAVLVIAIFYTDSIATWSLVAGVMGVGLSMAMNRAGVRSSMVYFLFGLVVWLAFLKSGVHATIAALLMAFTIPARARIDGRKLASKLEAGLQELRTIGLPADRGLNTPEQQRVLDRLARARDAGAAPLQDLEHTIAGIVTFFILPIFALANAGVSLAGLGLESLTDGLALGVILGLLLGKPLGIVGFSFVAVRLGLADLPSGATWTQIAGIGLLGGIGFTMALFIASLAFPTPADLESAKLGVLVASTLAAVAGLAVLLRAAPVGASTR